MCIGTNWLRISPLVDFRSSSVQLSAFTSESYQISWIVGWLQLISQSHYTYILVLKKDETV
jgi:hypothetical protein